MATTRRAFTAALGAGLAAGAWPLTASAQGGYPWPLGVQLWSVNAELDQDFDATLRRLSALGYREVETAGLHGRTPEAFRAAAESAGLHLVSAHYAMGDLLSDPERRIAEVKGMGAAWLVCSSPKPDRPLAAGVDWIPAIHQAMTLPAWEKNAAALQRLGAMAKAAGLRFAYHNHPIEFDRYDGRRGYDVLLAGTDPALVKLELDVAWAAAGGADPVALLRAHPGRFRLLHIKGLKTRPPLGRFGSDFTTGVVGRDDVIDWPAVIHAARRAGVSHAFVEQEPPHVRPIMETLAACRDSLQHLEGTRR